VPGNQVERALTSRESLLLRLSLVTAVWCSMTTVSHALHLGIAWARRRVERLLLYGRVENYLVQEFIVLPETL